MNPPYYFGRYRKIITQSNILQLYIRAIPLKNVWLDFQTPYLNWQFNQIQQKMLILPPYRMAREPFIRQLAFERLPRYVSSRRPYMLAKFYPIQFIPNFTTPTQTPTHTIGLYSLPPHTKKGPFLTIIFNGTSLNIFITYKKQYFTWREH